MSDRHRTSRRPLSAPTAPAFAGGLSWGALSLLLLTSPLLGGCPSGAAGTIQDAKPTRATPTAVTRVPSCEQGDLAAIARTLEGNRSGWTPGRGIVPDFSGYVAAALWKSCDLPEGARVLLANTVTVPKPAWEVEGKPKPADAEDPMERAMPGFAAAKGSGAAGARALAEFQQTRCTARDDVAKEVASLPVDQRSAAVFDRCQLPSTPLSREAFVASGLLLEGVGFVALHSWLLEAKLEPEVALALVQTLAVHRPARLSAAVEFSPPPALRLAPVAHGLPPREGSLVYVGPKAISVGHERLGELSADGSVAALIQSGVLASLKDALAPSIPAGGGTVILALDRSNSWPIVASVIVSAAKAGAADIDALVLGPNLQDALRRVPLAQVSATAPFGLTLEITASNATATCGGVPTTVAHSSVADAIASCPQEASVEVTVTGSPKLRDVLDAIDGLGERPRTLRGSRHAPPPT